MSGLRKIVLIGNFLPDRQESMLRFEQALTTGFTERGIPIETARPEPRFVNPATYRYGGLPKYLGYLDKFVLFPRRLRRLARIQPSGTVFHIVDQGNAVYAPALRNRPLLVTVNDLLQIRSARGEIPQNRIGRSGQRQQEWILKNLTQFPLAACISSKTREDLLRLAHIPPSAAVVVPMALNYPYRPMPPAEATPLLAKVLARQNLRWPANAAPAKRGQTLMSDVSARSAERRTTSRRPSENSPSPFLFGIGGGQWYKNRTGLIATFAALRSLPGQSRALLYVGPAFDAEQQAIIAQHDLADAILHIPNVDNEELRAAYSLADALIFPSWEEGFGWPVAEAQACGCPVFTSNRAPMTEVGGAGAVYIDPADPAASARIIATALADPAPLRAAGLVEAKRWAPQAMLDAYVRLYTLLLKPPRDHPVPAVAP